MERIISNFGLRDDCTCGAPLCQVLHTEKDTSMNVFDAVALGAGGSLKLPLNAPRPHRSHRRG